MEIIIRQHRLSSSTVGVLYCSMEMNLLHHFHHCPPPLPLFCLFFSHCQARDLHVTLCPLQLDTSTMTTPNPAARLTLSTTA